LYEKRRLLDVIEHYEREAIKYSQLRVILEIVMALLVYGFVALILSSFPPGSLSLNSLILIIDLLKLLLYYLIALFLTFAVIISAIGSTTNLSFAVYAGFIIAGLLIGISPELLPGIENPGVILQNISVKEIVYSGILFGIIIVGLLLLGFLRKGSLENLLYALLILYFGIIFAFIYSGADALGFQKVEELSQIYKLIFSKSFLLFFISFAMFELGGTYSQLSSQLKYISERTKRVLRQLARVYEVHEKIEKPIEKPAEIERSELFIKLSPLAATMLRDAYEGYAFLGEGTQLYVTSKLKSYVEFEINKDETLLDKILGQQISAHFSILSTIIVLILKLFITAGLMIVAFYITSYMITNIGYGLILETKSSLSFIVATYFIIFVFYIGIELIFRQRERTAKTKEEETK